MIDVYVVPAGATRYELYCEVPDVPDDGAEPPAGGFFSRMRQRFREMLAEAERERLQASPARSDASWFGRVKARIMRWVAESIAEQRLLWQLRKETDAILHYPDDMNEAEAIAVLRSQLRRDFEKHRFWLIIDLLLFLASGALMVLPGPNLIAYYFAFRVVGHYFSMRGARQALDAVTWKPVPSAPLSELRRAIDLAPDVRVRRVLDVAERLRLEHLPRFFERIAMASR